MAIDAGTEKVNMTAEGQPAGRVKEHIWDKKISKREFLGGVSAVASVAVGAYLVSKLGSSASEGTAPKVTEGENFVQRWQIEVDNSIAGTKSEAPFNRTLEQDVTLLCNTLKDIPQLGKCRVILTDGDRPGFDNDREVPEIRISRRTLPEFMQAALGHEAVHALDPDANYKELPKVLPAQDVQALREAKKKVLDDSIFSPNVPSIEKMFSKGKSRLMWDKTKNYNSEQLAQLVTIYPDSYWLMQGPAIDNSRSPYLLEPYLKDGMAAIEMFAKDKSAANYFSLSDFMDSNFAKLDSVAALSQMIGRAVELLRQRKALFTEETAGWLSGRSRGLYFGGRTIGDWWRTLPILINGLLAEAIYAQDVKLKAILGPDRARQIKMDLDNLKDETENERMAEMGRVKIMFGAKTPLDDYSALAAEISRRQN